MAGNVSEWWVAFLAGVLSDTVFIDQLALVDREACLLHYFQRD